MTTEELLNKLKNDKQYQARLKTREEDLQKRHEILVKESKSFSKDCYLLGYELETPWDLINISEPYPKLIPTLIKYLEQENYSSQFREGVARSLAVKDSTEYFDNILHQYNKTPVTSENVKWAIACALSESARTQNHYDIIEKLICDVENGVSRNALLDTVKRMRKEQKETILQYARTDVQLLPNLKMLGVK